MVETCMELFVGGSLYIQQQKAQLLLDILIFLFLCTKSTRVAQLHYILYYTFSLLSILTLRDLDMYSVSGERDQKYFLHNFNNFARKAIIFGKRYCESTRKLSVEQVSTLRDQCCYFTL